LLSKQRNPEKARLMKKTAFLLGAGAAVSIAAAVIARKKSQEKSG
jgi:hypothetical protein